MLTVGNYRLNNVLYGEDGSVTGRAEVFYNEEWGTVCDDNFDTADASVFCRSIGYSPMNAQGIQMFGGGDGPTWMDGLNCSGGEASLQECEFNGWGEEDCSHSEDVGVTCYLAVEYEVLTVGSYRLNNVLYGEDGSVTGRIEVENDGEWGTVCDDDFGELDAAVFCRSIGYSTSNAEVIGSFGGGEGTIWMDNVNCNGEEASLGECNFNGWGENNCSHSEDVGVVCYLMNSDILTVGSYRIGAIEYLEDGSVRGRVEVNYESEWGTVCDDDFDDLDAAVFCRSIGYSSSGATAIGYFGGGEGPTWMDQVACTGEESSLEECSRNDWGVEDCSHSEDVGVLCRPEGYTEFEYLTVRDTRLANVEYGEDGSVRGRLEVFYEGEWGTVCDDDFDSADAAVACFTLGLNAGNAGSYTSGDGEGIIWMDNLACIGNELGLE